MQDRSDALKIILHVVRLLNQSNRSAGQTYGMDLPLVESEILVEIKASPNITAAQIAERTRLSRMTLSRHIRGMTKRRWLKQVRRKDDARNVALAVTSAGAEILSEMIRRGRTAYGAAFERLTAREQLRFSRYAKVFAQGCGGQGAALPSDPALMSEVRAVTRGLGFLGNDLFFGSGVAPFDWQVLSLICHETKNCYFTDLVDIFSAPRGSISTVLTRLRKEGYLERLSGGSDDARKFSIVATISGKEKLAKIDALGLERIRAALSDLDDTALFDMADLAEKYAAVSSSPLLVPVSRQVMLTRLKTEAELNRARQFLITYYAKRPVKALPAGMGRPDGITFGIFTKGLLTGVIEFAPLKNDWELLHCCLLPGKSSTDHRQILVRAVEDVFKMTSTKRIYYRKDSVATKETVIDSIALLERF